MEINNLLSVSYSSNGFKIDLIVWKYLEIAVETGKLQQV